MPNKKIEMDSLDLKDTNFEFELALEINVLELLGVWAREHEGPSLEDFKDRIRKIYNKLNYVL